MVIFIKKHFLHISDVATVWIIDKAVLEQKWCWQATCDFLMCNLGVMHMAFNGSYKQKQLIM